MMIDETDIIEAHEKIRGCVHKTPVLKSRLLNELTGSELYFKAENFQKTGAFKARGAFNAVLSIASNKLQKGVATHSSGNHAGALAYAARKTGTKAYVVMPRNAPRNKIEAVKSYGAVVIFCEPTQESREKTLEKVVSQTCATFVHPYNNYEIIKGQATTAKELFEELELKLDYLLTPLGGGGLLSGSLLAAKYFSRSTKVIGVEPKGADDAYRSIRDGKIYPSVNPSSIADGLLTSLKKRTFKIISENVYKILTVNEHSIAKALFLIMERMKIVVEPSAAVVLAAVLENKELFESKRVGLILSGGNLDFSKIVEYKKLEKEKNG